MFTRDEQKAAKTFYCSQVQNGNSITVSWDAGGDSTPVWLDYKTVPAEKEEIHESVLRREIIMQLNLPNSGEEYHTGKGELIADESGLFIAHTSYEHEWLNVRLPEISVPVKDPYNMHDIPKAIRFVAYAEYQYLSDEVTFTINLSKPGSDINKLTPEQEAYYKNILQEGLAQHDDKMGKAVKDNEGEAIVIGLNIWLQVTGPKQMKRVARFTCHELKAVHTQELVELFSGV